MQVSEAENRFSEVYFGAGTADMFSDYRCPKCNSITTITDSEIRKSLFNDESIIPKIILKKMQELRPINEDDWEDFFDFNCKSCNNYIRLIYIPNEFRMAAHNFRLQRVIEA